MNKIYLILKLKYIYNLVMSSEVQDIIITFNDKDYVIDNTLNNILNSVMNDLNDVSIEKRIKIIKTILSVKLNLSLTKDLRIIDKLVRELFDEKQVKEILRIKYRQSQKKYYDAHKEEFREKYREKAEILKEYRAMKAQQQSQ